ncbi:thiamine pyrophosphate-binding protein [Rhodococcus sp. MS16]|uniref:thiamine pyrophosphate-binding protein n=1 Tax=Rhodococcus sp. MS16 TaxID=2579941 RepID=UPI00156213A2|nr:thiamine pyrophosphate-binding protein [Rhodococcus sp. MS16]
MTLVNTVADLVGRTLAELGVGYTFGVVGSGNFTVTNALRRHGVPFVAARHEGGAATMADAYARMSGTVAVVTTHQGCGLTNALTGITEAAKSRTPLIVLTADTAGAAVQSNFKIDQDGLARSVGAVAERVHSADSAVADTVRAFTTAWRERRTVVLNLPLDVQSQIAASANMPPNAPALQHIRPDGIALEKFLELLAAADRPVFVAGRGARDAGPEIAELARHTGALVATSAVANGLFHSDPFSLGISGGFSSPRSAELIAGADLVVGWGCALNMWTMRQGHLIGKDTTVVQIDLDSAALGAHRPIHLGIVGDSAATAIDALDALDKAPVRVGYRTDAVRDSIATESKWSQVPFEDLSTEHSIDPRLLSLELDTILPTERTVSVDSGNFMGYPSAYLSVPDHFGFCFTQAFQSIGLGLATAIGTALAQPDRLPVAALGDGGFLMGISELETVARLKLPLLIVVYNDSAYGAEVHHFTDPDTDRTTVTFPDTDLAAIARGYGADGLTVRTARDLDAVRTWVSGPRSGPLVIDAKISSDGGSWWLAEAFKGH